MSNQLELFKRKNTTFNFRCPYCGDSQKDKFKARGYLLEKKGQHMYYCHNCGVSKKFSKFLQDNNLQLYEEYSMEKLKESGVPEVRKQIDSITQPEAFPDYLRSGSPLRTIKKISQLAWDHPAKTYVLDRKIISYLATKDVPFKKILSSDTLQ